MELKIGIMTNQEMAEWFGIKEKSFRTTRQKKLEELKEYAIFEDMRGKVNIKQIIKKVYTKGSRDFKLIKEKTREQWNESGLDTCRLVAAKIAKKYRQELKVSDNTLYNYTCISKRELWGKTFGAGGEIGHCVSELCKVIDNVCIEFTEEENKIKKSLIKKHFGNLDEKVLFIKDLLENEEITKEESWELLEDIAKLDSNYWLFKLELQEKIGCKITTATRITTSAF